MSSARCFTTTKSTSCWASSRSSTCSCSAYSTCTTTFGSMRASTRRSRSYLPSPSPRWWGPCSSGSSTFAFPSACSSSPCSCSSSSAGACAWSTVLHGARNVHSPGPIMHVTGPARSSWAQAKPARSPSIAWRARIRSCRASRLQPWTTIPRNGDCASTA